VSDEPTIDLSFVREFPDRCCHETTRNDESQPCDKTAHAAVYNFDGHAWPVCIHHARGRRVVPLATLVNP
jgi:hypothetical protein